MGIFDKLFGSTPKKQPLHLDDQNFEKEVLKSDLPVVIDVWSNTCSHCKQLEPVITELANTYDGRVKVCEISANNAPRAMTYMRIQATPTVVYFNRGKELDRVTGFRSSLYHAQAIEELFGELAK